MRSRGESRPEWVQGHLAEAARIATLLTADPARGPVVAEESLAAALQLVPRRSRDGRLGDALLAQLVRRSRADAGATSPGLPEQLGVLRALPRRQRAALVLRHYAELTDDRSAVFLGCSPRAVADLVARAVRALPPDARADVHEWLDATPLPRPPAAPRPRSLLRRILQPRVLRSAAAATAIFAGAAVGVRVPELLEEPERPTRSERIAEIRQVLEKSEASLPFDPDDAGPGTGRMFPVVDGVVGGSLWTVTGYRDPDGVHCLQLVVAYDFGRRRCLGPTRAPVRAIVDLDREHDATFISGMVAPGIESLEFVGPDVRWMDVTIGRESPERWKEEPGFFGIALADEYVAVDSREAARDGGYEVMAGRLLAIDGAGKTVAETEVLLARA